MESWDVKTAIFLGGEFSHFLPQKYDFDIRKGILWEKKTPLLTKF
jgi:hypothetical protein